MVRDVPYTVMTGDAGEGLGKPESVTPMSLQVLSRLHPQRRMRKSPCSHRAFATVQLRTGGRRNMQKTSGLFLYFLSENLLTVDNHACLNKSIANIEWLCFLFRGQVNLVCTQHRQVGLYHAQNSGAYACASLFGADIEVVYEPKEGIFIIGIADQTHTFFIQHNTHNKVWVMLSQCLLDHLTIQCFVM